MVPEGWERVPLGEIAREVRDRFDPEEEPDLPYAGLTHVEPYRRRVPQFGVLNDVRSTKTRFRPGDVLFGKLRPYLHKVAQADREGGASTDMMVVRRRDGLDRDFLYWRLTSAAVVKWATRHSSGTKMPRTSWGRLAEFVVPLPPLPEQRKIAAILSSVDDAIAATRKVIEQTKRVKRGLLQTLMTRGIEHSRFKKTEIGEIPEEWEVVALSELVSAPICYGILKPGPDKSAGVPVIKVKNLGNGVIRTHGLRRTSSEIHQKYSRSELRRDDVLLSIRGTIGRVAIVPEALDGSNITQDTARIRPNADVAPQFIYFALQAPEARRQIQMHTIGQAVKGINLKEVRRLKIPLPPKTERQDIATVISSAESVLSAGRKTLSEFKTLKRGLMQDLLTGRVRVQPD